MSLCFERYLCRIYRYVFYHSGRANLVIDAVEERAFSHLLGTYFGIVAVFVVG